jgi:hypothetical protein
MFGLRCKIEVEKIDKEGNITHDSFDNIESILLEAGSTAIILRLDILFNDESTSCVYIDLFSRESKITGANSTFTIQGSKKSLLKN